VCGWNVACEVHVDVFNENQAVICPAHESCFEGMVVEDAAAVCYDLSLGVDGSGDGF
jgi:hypothetical protein